MGGPILAQEEIKTIFGSIPDIYDVHRKIKASLFSRTCANIYILVYFSFILRHIVYFANIFAKDDTAKYKDFNILCISLFLRARFKSVCILHGAAWAVLTDHTKRLLL